MDKTYLNDRKIIELTGDDCFKFIQGLITNDIMQLTRDDQLIYSAMLSPKGRFWYDFFIFANKSANKIYLDCLSSKVDEIVKKLSLYKLRSAVEIKINEKIAVFWSVDNVANLVKSYNEDDFTHIFQDPRSKEMGYRIYLSKKSSQLEVDLDALKLYHKSRIINKIPESEYDLTFDKSLILEFGFDNLNAINYEKGCYMGQELTARTHHTGQIRKKIYLISIANPQDFLTADQIKKVSTESNILKNTEITCNDLEIGILLSSVLENDKILALSLIKEPQDDLENFLSNLKVKNSFINIIRNANIPSSS